jgi:hypothetical protein
MSTVDLVVPWRDARNPFRLAAFERVLMHLNRLGELLDRDVRVTVGRVPSTEPWSPGAARNHGAAIADGDLLVFNDADSILSYRGLEALLDEAERAPGLVYGYDLYVRLDEELRVAETLYQTPSLGCVAILRECFEQVEGFDEHYQGWGYEDCDFAQRCQQRWPLRRLPGPLYHLWHGDRRPDDSPADSDPAQVERNLERWTRTVSTV